MPLAPAFPARWFDGLLRAHALRQTIRVLTDRMKSHIVKSMLYQFEHGRIYNRPPVRDKFRLKSTPILPAIRVKGRSP